MNTDRHILPEHMNRQTTIKTHRYKHLNTTNKKDQNHNTNTNNIHRSTQTNADRGAITLRPTHTHAQTHIEPQKRGSLKNLL